MFYTGETPWDGPTSIYDMMDLDADDRICSCVPDYPLHVIDIGHDKKLSSADQDLQDLQYALTQIYAEKEPDDRKIKNSILSLTGILVGDQKLYETMVDKEQGGSTKMCRALEKRDEEIRRRITEEKDAEMATVLKKRDAELEKKDAELAEKDARIRELEKLLADK